LRKLTISFGERHHAQITKVRTLEWAEFCRWLTKVPKETKTKEDRGWYCGAEFSPDEDGKPYRHSNFFVSRHVLTWDFDHVDVFAWDAMAEAFKNNAYALYTTFSHTDERPRFRLVLPLSRPAGYDEFQAVSRKLAQRVGLELIARESHVPCQFMFAPCRPAGGASLQDYRVDGVWIDVDRVLAEYPDWTDRDSWPRRADADRPTDLETKVSPLDKPGIVGAFCRAFPVSVAIEQFDLPYDRVR
jgi:putative DNA primase/helicase